MNNSPNFTDIKLVLFLLNAINISNKKMFSNFNKQTEILIIILLVTIFSLTGTGLNFGYAYLNDLDLTKIGDIFTEMPQNVARRFFRITSATHQVFTFILPCFFFWYLVKNKKVVDYFHLSRIPLIKTLVFGFSLLILSLPLVNLSAWLNQFLPLPQWAATVEADTAKVISLLLSVDHPIDWLLNIIVIAAIPAIGEELFFRGIVQVKLVEHFKNPHLAIWLGATFFSFFHFQFEGLFPRILLGALFGYIYYWSINLWIPIILHFFNNAILVSVPYFGLSEEVIKTDLDLSLSYSLLLSALGAIFLGYFLIKNRSLFLDHKETRSEEA